MTMHRSFQQTPQEKKRYVFDYSCWLGEGEQLSAFSVLVGPSTTPALTASQAYPNPELTSISVLIGGGVNRTLYTVSLLITTSIGQVKRDDIQMRITSP